MSKRNVADVLKGLGIDWKSMTIDQVRVAYIRDLREKAAGRGGDDQLNLSRQRAEESAVKTAMMRLEYNERIGELVAADDAAQAITEWCSSANRDYRTGINKLVGEIQSTFKIEIPTDMVEKIVKPTVERIQGHAQRAGRDIAERGGGVSSGDDVENSGLDQR